MYQSIRYPAFQGAYLLITTRLTLVKKIPSNLSSIPSVFDERGLEAAGKPIILALHCTARIRYVCISEP